MRISGAAADEAMARAGLLADSLHDLDLIPGADQSPAVDRIPQAERLLGPARLGKETMDSSTARSPVQAQGPAWVAPGSGGDSRSWGMPDRQGRKRATSSGVPAPVDVQSSSGGLGAVQPPPTLSADSMPVAEPSQPRGRPHSTLYASENSVPQSDPLMAALLDGVGANEALTTPPRIEPGVPPVGPTDPGIVPPSSRAPSRAGRVVAPHRGRRKLSVNTVRNDPRGRQIATHPEELDTMRRGGTTDPPVTAVGLPDQSPVGRLSAGAKPAVSSVEPPTSDEPLAGYTPSPGSDPDAEYVPSVRRAAPVPIRTGTSRKALPDRPSVEAGTGSRKLFAVGTMLAALTVASIGASAGLVRMGHINAIEATLDAGIGPNGPVPALPRDVDRVLADRELVSRVLDRGQKISGATDQFAISVELEQRVFGVPLTYHVVREGDVRIGQMMATMDFFRAGGWTFDKHAEDRLAKYKAKNSSKLRPTTTTAPVLVETSEAAVPTTEPEEGEEGEDPDPTPSR